MKDSSFTPEILVINDSQTQLRYCVKLLKNHNYKIRTFLHAAEALEEISEGYCPDLVLTDIYMPKIDGWKLCRLLRSREFPSMNDVPVILFSSTFTGVDIEEITREIGADAFLPYPLDEKELNNTITELISGKKKRRKPKVLIIDDDADICEIIRLNLDTNGYETHVATSGKEGRALFEKISPDLVILDHHLPDITGLSLLHKFKEDNNRAAVIMITGDPSPELAVELMHQGADAYVRKPFDVEYLLELAAKVRREYGLIRVEKLLDERSRLLREQNIILREITGRYEKILTNSPDGYLLLHSDLEISSVNESFLKLFHLEHQDVVGRNLEEIAAGPDVNTIFRKFAQFVIKMSDIPTRVKTEIEDRGTALEVLFSPVNKQNQEILCIVTDISEKYKLEKAKMVLFKIARDANSVENLDELFHKIHTHLSELIDTTNFYIALIDQKNQLITFPYFVDKEDKDNASPVPLGTGLTSIVYQANHSLFLRDISAERIRQNFGVEIVGTPSKCWLGVPLRIKSEVVGVIVVQSYSHEDAYSYKDIELLEFCSEQIATVIERKRTEIALKNSENLYRSIVEKSPAGIFLVDENYKFVFANEQFASLLKSSKDEIVSSDIRNYVAPESMQMVMKYYKDRQSGKSVPERYIFRGLTSQGETRDFDISLTIVTDHKGHKRTLGQILDVTEQLKVQAELQKREKEYRTVFENSGTGLCILEKDLSISQFNDTLLKMTGLPRERLLNSRIWMKLIDRRDIKRMLEYKEIRVKNPSAVPSSYEVRGISKDGESRDLLLHIAYIPETQQTVASIVDITDLKRMERALQEQKERLSVTLRSIGDGVITTDINGKVELMNRRAEKLLSTSYKKWLGKPFHSLFRTYDIETKNENEFPLEAVLSGISTRQMYRELGLKTCDNKELIISVSCTPIHDRKSRIIGSVVVFRDITTQLKTEAEMSQIEKIQSVGILAGGIAHDFNNILAAILGNISLARLECETESILFEILRDAERECLRAKGLTQQLLTFAKGGVPIKEITSMKDLLEDSVSFNLRGSKVSYTLEIDPDLYPVDIDTSQISQVVGNLVINAQQAMPLGGTIHVKASNTVLTSDNAPGALPPGKYVKVSISDQGVGISKENLKKIFDPYFTTKQKGSGLGLTTCFSIIRKHDGYITAESELGKGSTFIFYLPGKEAKVCSHRTITMDMESGGERILVMDDDKSVQKSIQKLLKKFGYKIEVVPDGEKAILRYKEEMEKGTPFDLIIMDLTIPGGMGGAEAIQELLKIDPNVKSIVFSGYSNDPVMAHYKEYGFHGVVTKPFSIKEITTVIRKVLRDSETLEMAQNST